MATKKKTTGDEPEQPLEGQEAIETDGGQADAEPTGDGQPESKGEPSGPQAAPLEPPAMSGPPVEPKLGSATNPVAGAAAVQTMPGDKHAGLVVEVRRGVFEPADPEDLWTEVSKVHTWVQAKNRIHEEFWHVGAAHPDRRLLFPQGAKVPRDQAAALTARAKEQQEAAASAEV